MWDAWWSIYRAVDDEKYLTMLSLGSPDIAEPVRSFRQTFRDYGRARVIT